MEFQGLITKFKVDRPLNEEEQKYQLNQETRLEVDPIHQFSVVTSNSCFLESVDKYFSWKGTLTFWVGCCFLACLVAWSAISFSVLFLWNDIYPTGKALKVVSLVSVMLLPAAGFFLWGVLKESFRHTHYPIRFNRQNRQVYVFRLDGSVLETPWAEVFFTFGRASNFMGIQTWDIRGHVLGEDGKTVRETFALAVHSTDQEDLARHWEFIRRYMEDGPEAALAPHDLVCHNIDQSRESFYHGLRVLFSNLFGLPFFQILLMPFLLPSAVGRFIAMRTSKIPQWPDWVEQACKISPEDPCQRNGRSHPIDW